MFKKAKLLLLGAAALVSLVGCGQSQDHSGSEDEFDQNDSEFDGFEMYVVGSHWNSWTPATIKEAEGCKFEKQEGTAVQVWTATITQEMVDAWCGFKFISDSSWSSQFGMEDVNYDKSNQEFIDMVGAKENFHEGTSNRNNIVVTKPGTIKVEYDPLNYDAVETTLTTYTNKFAVTFTASK